MDSKWAIYSVCNVPLGIGKIIKKSDLALEISYGNNHISEVYSKKNCTEFSTLNEAILSFGKSNKIELKGIVKELLLAFPDEKNSLEIFLE
jgi:hypothetical protein